MLAFPVVAYVYIFCFCHPTVSTLLGPFLHLPFPPPRTPPLRLFVPGAQMATDDVVLLLVCCIVDVVRSDGGELPLLADLAFMKAFHFCEDSASAVYFALSTLEVKGGGG